MYVFVNIKCSQNKLLPITIHSPSMSILDIRLWLQKYRPQKQHFLYGFPNFRRPKLAWHNAIRVCAIARNPFYKINAIFKCINHKNKFILIAKSSHFNSIHRFKRHSIKNAITKYIFFIDQFFFILFFKSMYTMYVYIFILYKSLF